MDKNHCLASQPSRARIRESAEKHANSLAPNAVTALEQTATQQLKSDALRQVGHLALAALGAGAAARGGVGLLNHIRRAVSPVRVKTGPALLPLPYPIEPEESPEAMAERKRRKLAGFLAGDAASSRSGVPWYGPAMLAGGLGGFLGGWKGLDALLEARRKRERHDQLDTARQEFHDALLSQYDAPLSSKTAAASESRQLGRELDQLCDVFEKLAVDWGDLAGKLTGGYGMYAGLSGLVTGALVYDKAQKRSRRAILEKALQRRQRQRFAQQPTEIYAIPEPIEQMTQPDFKEEMGLLAPQ